MKLTRAFGLAVVAAVAAMAFVGAGSASAADEITLCKSLVNAGALCASNNFFPSGTKVVGLAINPTLKTSIETITCPHSEVELETLASMGLSILVDVRGLYFGELNSKLGGGCTGCEQVHTDSLYHGKIIVEGTDHFFLESEGSATLLNCFLGVDCIYGGAGLKLLIDPDSKKHSVNEALADVVLAEETLTKKTGSNFFCPNSGVWNAEYISRGCREGASFVPCYISLIQHLTA